MGNKLGGWDLPAHTDAIDKVAMAAKWVAW